ncbi:hypothetical protein, partial [Xenorhabdus bovienii]|uniref:hypothetical protein n=1 Tax=Xenorhabdus bovienii TaxID=40576 RepID=UPI00237CDE00
IVHFPLARKMPTIATDRPSEKLHLLGESKNYSYYYRGNFSTHHIENITYTISYNIIFYAMPLSLTLYWE